MVAVLALQREDGDHDVRTASVPRRRRAAPVSRLIDMPLVPMRLSVE